MNAARAYAIELADPARGPDELVPLVDAYRVFYGLDPDPGATRAFVAERFARGDT